ncbi:hypothetical protein [Escherichia coli]|nr:hypothetical protein [Escherichia coli]
MNYWERDDRKEHYRVMRWKKTANHEVITMAIRVVVSATVTAGVT